MSLGSDNRTRQDVPRGDLAMTRHPADVSPLTLRVLPSVYVAHPLKSLPFSRVAERALERCGYQALVAEDGNLT